MSRHQFAPVVPVPDEPQEAAEARAMLIANIAADGTINDPAVLEAMALVPRHEFVPAGTSIDLAYQDRPLPIGWMQTISQPYIVALMTQALLLSGRERVLEIGTGSGYQAAVLSLLSHHVDSIEVIPELAAQARARLLRLGYLNVDVHIGDGYHGFAAGAPFDRIILTAAPPELPSQLLDQLIVGGILVAPVGSSAEAPSPSSLSSWPKGEQAGEQRLMRWRKLKDKLLTEDLAGVRFVPMLPGG